MSSPRNKNYDRWPIQGGHPQRGPRRARKGKSHRLAQRRARSKMVKLELKAYTKEVVQHRAGLEIVENIASKQFAHNGAHAAGSRK